MKILDLEVVAGSGLISEQFRISRMVNAGYVGRDIKAVQAHIDELKHLGVPAPPKVPMIFPVLCDILTTNTSIEVIGDATSGEAEFVLIFDRDEIFVGVGSDHTDRALEAHDLVKSKQICPNVLSMQLWPYEEVSPIWDELVLRSLVKKNPDSELVLYQEAVLGTIISPPDLIDMVKPLVSEGNMNGMAIFSGTIPLLNSETIYGSFFCAELFNPHSGKRLTCSYQINQLDFLGNFE